jgi:RNA polymerase-binding transcription factor DksA
MADDIDLANDLFANELSYALSKIRQNAAQPSIGPKTCLECGDDMPEGRRHLGFKFCVSCAEERERKKQLFAD